MGRGEEQRAELLSRDQAHRHGSKRKPQAIYFAILDLLVHTDLVTTLLHAELHSLATKFRSVIKENSILLCDNEITERETDIL